MGTSVNAVVHASRCSLLRSCSGSALVCLLLSAGVFPAPAAAQERYAVLVSGVAGGEKYAAQQQKWRTELAAFLATNFAFSDANVVVLEENSDGSSKSTADYVQRLFGDLRRRVTRDD